MDKDQNNVDPVRSSAKSSIDLGNKDLVRCKVSVKDIVCALVTFIRTETEEKDGVVKDFVIRKCPKGKYCKNSGNGEIRYQNKTGSKNPCLHLRSCLAKVR